MNIFYLTHCLTYVMFNICHAYNMYVIQKTQNKEVMNMSVKYALLGLLSRDCRTGYDLKKIITDSTALYWLDDGNQIYEALIQLHKEGLVTSKAQKQADLPAKKVYSITESGLSELKKWVASTPEPPRIMNSFLVRLASADLLEDIELNALLEKYENEVKMQLLILQEKIRRENADFDSSKCSAYLWKIIMEHVTNTYENELNWIEKMKGTLRKSVIGGDMI